MKSARLLLLTLGGLGVSSLLLALLVGSSAAGVGTLLDWWSGTAGPEALEVMFRLRLPRALAAFGTGAALAVAGALMQVLLRNPLADPYVLGTSSGAAVTALGAMLLGATGLRWMWRPLAERLAAPCWYLAWPAVPALGALTGCC